MIYGSCPADLNLLRDSPDDASRLFPQTASRPNGMRTSKTSDNLVAPGALANGLPPLPPGRVAARDAAAKRRLTTIHSGKSTYDAASVRAAGAARTSPPMSRVASADMRDDARAVGSFVAQADSEQRMDARRFMRFLHEAKGLSVRQAARSYAPESAERRSLLREYEAGGAHDRGLEAPSGAGARALLAFLDQGAASAPKRQSAAARLLARALVGMVPRCAIPTTRNESRATKKTLLSSARNGMVS